MLGFEAFLDELSKSMDGWGAYATSNHKITNDDKQAILTQDVAGFDKKDITVEVVPEMNGQINILKISGSNGKGLREQFTDRYRLGDRLDIDKITSSMNNGLLTVNVPLQKVKKSDIKSITIS